MRAVSGLAVALLVATSMIVVTGQAWANGTWYANFRGGATATVAVGDTCDKKLGNELSHDVPNDQLRFTFSGGVRGQDVYIRDVVITVGPGRDGFRLPGGVRVYGSGGVVDGYVTHLGPNETYRFTVDKTYRYRAAVEFFPQIGFGGDRGACGVTQIAVQEFDQ